MRIEMELQGKVAVVTGGSRGIGKAIAIKLASAGAQVVLTYQSQSGDADNVVSTIKDTGGAAVAVQMEVSQRVSVREVFAFCDENFGGVDVLVNNAGINNPTDFNEITDEDWDNILSVNLKGPFLCSQEVLASMEKKGGGSIINIGSVSGQYGGPRTAHYAASKAGLMSLGQVVARFGAEKGIRCNTVAAGLIESEMAASGMQSPAVAKAAETIVQKRFGRPEEVADAVLYLASEQSSYITAQTLNVNGGLYF